jgi:uncharacterized membrane protein YhaH (DUF805 family)
MNWYLAVLKNYVGFAGRARRMEYWMFMIVNFLVYAGLLVIDRMMGHAIGEYGPGPLCAIYGLAVALPWLAVVFRRLHDTDRTGLWIFIHMLPLLGSIIFFIFMVMDSTPGTNRFGPNPKSASA